MTATFEERQAAYEAQEKMNAAINARIGETESERIARTEKENAQNPFMVEIDYDNMGEYEEEEPREVIPQKGEAGYEEWLIAFLA